MDSIRTDLMKVLEEFLAQITIKPNRIMVIGCSTSEVLGARIGKNGSFEVAEIIFNELRNFSTNTGINLAFQCCEHLNRALVIEREFLERNHLEEVTVVPVLKAGGAMAAYAYRNFKDPCLVEELKADYGIDIGDTFIGMHLKSVAVPIRVSVKKVGEAHITLAKTRPKLIGGERAVYSL